MCFKHLFRQFYTLPCMNWFFLLSLCSRIMLIIRRTNRAKRKQQRRWQQNSVDWFPCCWLSEYNDFLFQVAVKAYVVNCNFIWHAYCTQMAHNTIYTWDPQHICGLYLNDIFPRLFFWFFLLLFFLFRLVPFYANISLPFSLSFICLPLLPPPHRLLYLSIKFVPYRNEEKKSTQTAIRLRFEMVVTALFNNTTTK